MFDTITDKLFCPFCGTKNEGFQTKGLSNTLDEWTIKEIRQYLSKRQNINIYNRCKNCKEWIEIIIEGENDDKCWCGE